MKKQYIKELVSFIKNQKPNKKQLFKYKTKLCKKYHVKDIPTDIEVLLNTDEKDIKKFLIEFTLIV